MKHHAGLLALAALVVAFTIPAGAAAQSESSPQMNNNTQTATATGEQEASQMVPARAALDHTLDAKNATPGQTFQAKLATTVHLKDGQDLPRGTMLIGKVAQDDMNVAGKSKLALCIDQAKLKDGKTIPVKATIVGLYGPGTGTAAWTGYNVSAGNQVPNDWNNKVTQVDEIGALSGVDLHSKIGSQNSGVLVSTKKDDIKVKTGTELALAIAPENQNQDQNGNPGGNR